MSHPLLGLNGHLASRRQPADSITLVNNFLSVVRIVWNGKAPGLTPPNLSEIKILFLIIFIISDLIHFMLETSKHKFRLWQLYVAAVRRPIYEFL